MLDQVKIKKNENLKSDFANTCVDFLMRSYQETLQFLDAILKTEIVLNLIVKDLQTHDL